MPKGILLLSGCVMRQLYHTVIPDKDHKIRLVLENTNTLFIPKELPLEVILWSTWREGKTVWKGFFPSDNIFKKSFSTALLCSSKSPHPRTLLKRSVQFYHSKRLNFFHSTGLTSLLSSSWHRPNLLWARVSLSPIPPLPALTAP